MDRYKEGYNDCNREWKKKIEEVLYQDRDNLTLGYRSSYIELIEQLEDLLKKG